jgi:cytochrome c-type biogenesis protein CcmH/NrfG
MRAPPELRLGLAAATAGCLAFAAAAGVDWEWELGVMPAVFLMLAACCVVAGSSYSPSAWLGLRRDRPGVRRARRGVVVGLSVVALVAIALPLAATNELDQSQESANAGDLGAALSSAETARDVQPYAASPRLQEALLLELDGRFDAAAAAAREATRDESTNWRTWLILSRLEARRGAAAAATQAYRRARSLNPLSGSLAP